MITTLFVAASLLVADPSSAGTRLIYEGTFAATREDSDAATKKFTLDVVVLEAAESKIEAAWVFEESRSASSWTDHFGIWRFDPSNRDVQTTGPALLIEHAEGRTSVDLPPFFFKYTKDLILKDVSWTEGRFHYRVAGQEMRAGRECWVTEVQSPYGHKRTLWIEQKSPLVVAVSETVFLGQGREHKLTLELAKTATLGKDELAATSEALDVWTQLREQLGRKPRSEKSELSAEQIATLKAELPKTIEAAGSGLFAGIAQAAQKDAQAQRGRAGAVAAMRDEIVGKPFGDFKLPDASGKAYSQEDIEGKVIVLHVWEYRDAPLEEPYGQVGYLDFLTRKRADVKVIGLHVDPRLEEEEGRRASIAGVRRLKAFMNLSYPVLLDDGSLLKRLGDPRQAGGSLPLFVVIGKDGKVVEYHAGLYEVKANEGLAELDAVVAKALDAK